MPSPLNMIRTMTRPLLLSGLVCLSTPLLAEVTVSDARIRAVPPSSSNSAAYLSLHNSAATAVSLEKVSSQAAAAVELHQVTEVNGMLRMSQVPSIEVPANGTIQLKPGGLHIMLLDLTAPLQEGALVTLTLEFNDGQQLQLEAPVMRLQPKMGHKNMGHQMQHSRDPQPESASAPHH